MITEVKMGWGSFELELDPGTPGRVLGRLNDAWFGLVKVFPARIQEDQLDAVTPIFTGVLLDRPTNLSISGAGPAWFLGTASDISSVEQVGPITLSTISKDGVANGALEGWVDSILDLTDCGIVTGTVWGPSSATKKKGTFRRKTPKTMLDSWVCPKFGVSYRVNHDLTLDIGYPNEVWPDPATKPLAIKRGGRGLGVKGLSDVQISMNQSARELLMRVTSIVDWSYLDTDDKRVERTTIQTENLAGWDYKNPQGVTLPLTMVKQGPSSEADNLSDAEEDALKDAEAELDRHDLVERRIEISTSEFAITDRVEPGAKIWVYDVAEGIFDQNTAVLYQGQWVYPLALRVEEVTWPVQAGMSVWLDDRHQSGVAMELTEYVDLTSEGGETTITAGAAPSTLGRITRLPGRR